MKNTFIDDLMQGVGFNNFSELPEPKIKELINERFGYRKDEPYNLDTEKLDLLMYQDAKERITKVFKYIIEAQKAKCEVIEYKQLKESEDTYFDNSEDNKCDPMM